MNQTNEKHAPDPLHQPAASRRFTGVPHGHSNGSRRENHQLFTHTIDPVLLKAETPSQYCDILSLNFQIAAKGIGKYCDAKNELLVRKGGKIYRFSCGECVFRFTPPSHPEIVFPIAPDTTVHEFRRSIAMLIDSPEHDGLHPENR